MVSLADRCRQTSTSKAPPFALQPPTAEWFALSTLPATTDIPLVLVGRTSAGVAVGVAVGRGHLDNNGAVVVDTVESGAVDFATADVVEIFASATKSALIEMIATTAASAGASAGATAAGAAVVAHVGAADPHGDRAYAKGLADGALGAIGWDGIDAGEVGLPGWTYGNAQAVGTAGLPGRSYLVPLSPTRNITTTNVCLNVSVVGDVVDVSIWEVAPIAGAPGFVPVARVANVAGVDVSTTGYKVVPLAAPLVAGKSYVVLVTMQAACTLTGWVQNGQGLRMVRLSSTQAQVVTGIVADTGYPLASVWPGTAIVTSFANGALGYRAQAQLQWGRTP